MLAPPFTASNAADNARKAVIAREKNRALKRERLLALNDDEARARIKGEIDKILGWMNKAREKSRYALYVSMLDKLWSKAYPEQAATRGSKRSSRGSIPDASPAETPAPTTPVA